MVPTLILIVVWDISWSEFGLGFTVVQKSEEEKQVKDIVCFFPLDFATNVDTNLILLRIVGVVERMIRLSRHHTGTSGA